jgi:hypothetical protein
MRSQACITISFSMRRELHGDHPPYGSRRIPRLLFYNVCLRMEPWTSSMPKVGLFRGSIMAFQESARLKRKSTPKQPRVGAGESRDEECMYSRRACV